ncbi:MAG: DUF2007 domain-containing protein [Amphritea sp.]
MQEVYRAGDITEAHIIAGMLESQGIDSHVGGHYLQGGVGELASMNFATVSVPEEDVVAARELINEYEITSYPAVSASNSEGVALSRYMLLPLALLVVLGAVYLLAISVN